MKFKDLKKDDAFTFDGEEFVLTEECKKNPITDRYTGTAWSIRNGERYKEWAFFEDDKVSLLSK